MFLRFAFITSFCGLLVSTVDAAPLGSTTRYAAPVDVTPVGTDHDFASHAVTRLVDWNGDELNDLVVGGGDGRVWIAIGQSQQRFATPVEVMINDRPIKMGEGLTSACFVDINGDTKNDLVVAHDGEKVSWGANVSDGANPKFDSMQSLVDSDGKAVELPANCGARIDVGDWDGDGDPDLIAGAFTGPIVCFENIGSTAIPRFAPGTPLMIDGNERGYSYNVHPTLFDVNQDGLVDVAYGMNWGNIGFLMASSLPDKVQLSTSRTPIVTQDITPRFASGAEIDLREIAGDDATPTFGDLDGDGTLDMVSGGRNGKLFWLRGIPISESLARIEAIMDAHRDDLGKRLASDENLRKELVGLHQSNYGICQGFLNTPASRQLIRDWYVEHVAKHARYLKWAHRDLAVDTYIPSLAYQVWTTLMLMHAGDPDAKTHREFVADTIGFEGRLKAILVEFGTLVIENGNTTPNQLETLYSYLDQIPPILLGDRSVPAVTEVITIADYLGPRFDVMHAGGVNIFDNDSGVPGSSENPFPKDGAPCENDYFGVVLAHELNHRVDATRFRSVPKYDQKYWDHMQKICGANVKFNPPSGIGVDWDATKQHFQASGMWDGVEGSWNTAWADYWLTGPGKTQTMNVCRNETTYNPPRYGIPFFLETRQESIASLANQYFTNSFHMFQFALDRFDRGYPGCLDEWLLMADVYSLDRDFTYLYRHPNGQVTLDRIEAKLKRNAAGHIAAIEFGGRLYQFELDERGLVENVVRPN